MPNPETCSSLRGDTDEPDSGLPSGAQRCEKPGGWKAVESMVGEKQTPARRLGGGGVVGGTLATLPLPSSSGSFGAPDSHALFPPFTSGLIAANVLS
jgi:hypothetical protein